MRSYRYLGVKKVLKKKRGQVWVETVIYILIGLSLIALVLAFVVPRVTQQKDKSIVDQTIASLGVFDRTISDVLESGRDNRRTLEFSMSVGELTIDAQNDEIIYVLEGLSEPYSQPGVAIPVGRVLVESTESGSDSSVSLSLAYSGDVEILFEGANREEKFSGSKIPYRFSIRNTGTGIDIEKIS